MVVIVICPKAYEKEIVVTTMRDQTVTIENWIPQLTDEEQFEQRKKVEKGLNDIFIKYQEKQ